MDTEDNLQRDEYTSRQADLRARCLPFQAYNVLILHDQTLTTSATGLLLIPPTRTRSRWM